MSQPAGIKNETSLPPPPLTSLTRAQSPSSHAAASTLAGLAKTSPPSASKSSPVPRPTQSSSKLPQGLYSSQSSSAAFNSSSPLRKELDLAQRPNLLTGNSQRESSSSTSPVSSTAHPGTQKESAASRRKKANRACSHCQKAHLTCDDARPCTRCIKKGVASSCTDGVRKKAKYLLDDEELEELKRVKEAKKAAKLVNQERAKQGIGSSLPQARPGVSAQSQPRASSTRDYMPQHQPDAFSGASTAATAALSSLVDQAGSVTTPASSGHGPSPHQSGEFMSTSNFDISSSTDGPASALPFELNFDTSMHNFGSEATSLEYSILSSMLNETMMGGPSSGSPDLQNSPAVGVMNGWNISDAHQNNGESGLDNQLIDNPSHSTDGLLPGLVGMDPMGSGFGDSTAGEHARFNPILSTVGGSLQELSTENGFNALEVSSPKPARQEEGVQQDASDPQGGSNTAPYDLGSSSQRSTSNEPVTDINQAIASRRYARQQQDANWRARIAKTYRDNTAPFPYPKGYHFLIKYVTEKFQKAEALRIVRALAIFRPSLIALQMPLTEEDEIFVERALQRTILEFEKLISFSGTPTVVWRRTCEICVVGAEFCMLTHWSRDQLMGRRIYEFMDTDSTLDYWEKFALHAFENTSQSVMTTCTLVKPDGRLVPCAWSFTIKRDTFDLPSLIVGNFLPILS